MHHKIVIVGKPNVGKSSLFNRLTGRKLAIVDDIPGVTRDNKEYLIRINNLPLILVDTAGWEQFIENGQQKKLIPQNVTEEDYIHLQDKIKQQIQRVILESSILLFVLDGRNGLSSNDFLFLDFIRKTCCLQNEAGKILLLINKIDGPINAKNGEDKYNIDINEITAFGFEYLYISAKHGIGIDVLRNHISRILTEAEMHTGNGGLNNADTTKDNDAVSISDENPGNLTLAIVGRPNVGKSTLLNKILGYDRVITSNVPGTTRDTISVIFELAEQENLMPNIRKQKDLHEQTEDQSHNNHLCNLYIIDTAGMRKRGKVLSDNNNNNIEFSSVGQSIAAIKRANVVILVLDATESTTSNIFAKQDLTILDLIVNEGKGLVILFNKCDLIENLPIFKEFIRKALPTVVTKISNIPVIFTSLIEEINKKELLRAVDIVYKAHKTQLKTAELNKWLVNFSKQNPKFIKDKSGIPIKLKYITQTGVKPPTFSIFTNTSKQVSQTHVKFLSKSFADHFNLTGVPLRICMKNSNNPYVKHKR